jgi:hypothetical protein
MYMSTGLIDGPEAPDFRWLATTADAAREYRAPSKIGHNRLSPLPFHK